MAGNQRWPRLAATTLVGERTLDRLVKRTLAAPLTAALRATLGVREQARRIWNFSRLAAALGPALPYSTVVLGRTHVYGTGHVSLGNDCLLYPDQHLETQGRATITLGSGCVLSRGVHLVAMAGITVGDGTMIGEYSSLRDANHARIEGTAIRNAGHTARPITVGREVWIGRGVTVLGGVTIGDGATVGANAVVTKDVAAGGVVAGVPAKPIARGNSV